MKTLTEIEASVNELNRELGANEWQLPTYGFTRDGGYSHVEVSDGLYHLVSVERGRSSRVSTANLDELLYWIFAGAATSLANHYELHHRIPGQDFRRLMFAKRLELLAQLNPEWEKRQRAEIEETLRHAPYDDSL